MIFQSLKKIIFISLFIQIFIIFPLLSEEENQPLFQKNKMYFDFGGGRSNMNISGSDPSVFFGYAGLSSVSQSYNQNLLGLGFISSTLPTDTSPSTLRFVTEYGLSKWIGIGGSLNYTPLNISSYTYGQGYLNNLFFAPIIRVDADIINSYSLISLLPDNRPKKLSFLSTDFELSFHAPVHFSNIDPYVKLVVGSGTINPTSGNFSKSGGILGLRLGITDSTHISFEYFKSSYQINSIYFPADYESGRRAREEGFRFLIGTSFSSP
jgi:hypothetical protein